MKKIKKGLWGCIAVSMAAATIVGAPSAHADTPVTINIASSKAGVTALMTNALIQQGYDVANGFTLNRVEVAAANAILSGLAGGSIDIAPVTIDNAIAFQKQIPVVAWREIMANPFWDFVIRKDYADAQGITSKDSYATVMTKLAKANVGGPIKLGAADFAWQQLVAGANVTWTGTFVPGVANLATATAQLTAKSIDVAMVFEPFGTQLVQQGLAVQPFSVRDGAPGLPDVSRAPGLTMVSTGSWFAKNKDMAIKIDKAFDQAAAYLKNQKNFAKAVALLQEYNPTLDNPTSIAIVKKSVNYFSSNGAINQEAWNRVGAWYKNNAAADAAVTKGSLFGAKDFVYDLSIRDIKPLKKGTSLSAASLAKSLNLNPNPKSVIKLLSFTPKICKVTGSQLEAKAAGLCEISVEVFNDGAKNFQTRSSRANITIK
jgi:ABC-type nitrate/sulfonate/bicarbonate transport system substrate-binding protein